MALDVKVAASAEEKEALYRFRYQVYVEELGVNPPEADPQRKILRDPLDEYAVNYVLTDSIEVVGALRYMRLTDIPDPETVIKKYDLSPAMERFGPGAICTTSRFMLHPRLRHGRAVLRLMEAPMVDAFKQGVRFSFGDCSPHLIPFYEHLGYRRYTRAYNDTSFGFKVPILMIVSDQKRFELVRSPLGRIAKRYPDDEEARIWFEQTYRDYADLLSAALLPEGAFFDVLVSRVSSDPAHSMVLMKGLSREQMQEFLKEATMIHADPNHRIIRQGERNDTLYALLSGIAEVFIDEAPNKPIAIYGAGDVFGEMGFLTSEPRTANVIAKSKCELLVFSADFFQRFIQKEPAIAARVLLNLSGVLASRVASTTKLLSQ